LRKRWDRKGCRVCGDTPFNSVGLCARCQTKRVQDYQRRHPEQTKAHARRLMKKRGAELRAAVLLAYGNVCACCGESHKEFLVIDHVDDNGAAHRRQLFGSQKGSGQATYRWLQSNGFPPGFQTLCHNCNWAKAHGGCPHQREREGYVETVFRNAYLSVSRIKRFEECAAAFRKQYVVRPENFVREFSEPAEFGTVAHGALERTYRWIQDDEYAGPFPKSVLLEAFQHAWTESGLVGVDLYSEGRELMRQYAEWAGPVDHMNVLAVEKEFNLLVGPGVCRLIEEAERPRWEDDQTHYVVNGFIDRVDRKNASTIEVVDFKSNRLLFSREELDADIQVGVYAMVAKLLYPWAKQVDLAFQMLRHGPLVQRTERTETELAILRGYLIAVGVRTENGPYPERLNKNCSTCDWRNSCLAYRTALSQKPTLVNVSREDMVALSEERERVAAIAKAAYARKEQLDAALRDAVGDRESLQLGSFVYRVLQFFNTEYRAADLIPLFEEVGVDLGPALAIDNDALDKLLDRVEADESVPKMVRDFLRARCASRVVRLPQKPRIDSRAAKKR